jgi:hypothetical protein
MAKPCSFAKSLDQASFVAQAAMMPIKAGQQSQEAIRKAWQGIARSRLEDAQIDADSDHRAPAEDVGPPIDRAFCNRDPVISCGRRRRDVLDGQAIVAFGPRKQKLLQRESFRQLKSYNARQGSPGALAGGKSY